MPAAPQTRRGRIRRRRHQDDAAALQRLIKEPDVIAGAYDIHWLEKFLAANKA